MLRISRHQTLLHREDEIVRGVQRGRRQRRVGAAETDLQGANRLAQRLGNFTLIVEAQPLDVVEQAVGLRHQRPTSNFDAILISSRNGCSGHLSARYSARWFCQV
jgi:hypothetical protein